jgi:hypothetical protein
MRKLADGAKAPRRRKKEGSVAPPAEAGITPQKPVPADLQEAHDTAEWKLGMVGGRGIANKSEQEIKAWVDKKAVELLPQVVADLSFDLKYGTDKQRAEARDRIMDMHGLRKREAAAGNHSTIVLNIGDQNALKASLPWLSRSDKASEDGEK